MIPNIKVYSNEFRGNYIPHTGEVIAIMDDYENIKYKVGDGHTPLLELPFIDFNINLYLYYVVYKRGLDKYEAYVYSSDEETAKLQITKLHDEEVIFELCNRVESQCIISEEKL